MIYHASMGVVAVIESYNAQEFANELEKSIVHGQMKVVLTAYEAGTYRAVLIPDVM